MITAISFLIILSILVLVHELGHFLVAKKNNIFVEEFGLGLPPRIFGRKIGETLYSINLLPFGGFVKLLGEEQAELKNSKLPSHLKKRTFTSKSTAVKISVIVAGVIFNFLLGWVIISLLFIKGIPVPTDHIIIESIMNASPAQKAGLKPGDSLLSITSNDKKTLLNRAEDLTSATRKNAGLPVKIDYLRDGQTKTTTIVPRIKPPRNEGPLGIVITQFTIKKYPWYQAPLSGLIESGRISYLIVRELASSVFKLVTFQKISIEVAGPIGIAKYTSQALQFGLPAVLQLMGLLSLNLAVINILPFPALDGGKLAIIIYEAVSRKKINPNTEARLNLVGFSLLLGLICIITLYELKKYGVFAGVVNYILKTLYGS